MSEATDLQALVASLKADQISQKASLDAIKTGVATIVAGIPVTGGLTAEETAALKASLVDLQTGSTANTQEASDDAAAVGAAQPAPVV